MQQNVAIHDIRIPGRAVNVCAISLPHSSQIILSYLFSYFLGFRTFFFAWL